MEHKSENITNEAVHASSARENLAMGAVWIWRSMKTKSWYKKSEFTHLFLHLLIMAAYKGYETWFNGSTVILKPGQLVTGRKKLAEETGINEHKVDRILKVFETERQIEQLTTSTSRLITILNWEVYQNIAQRNEQRLRNEYTTTTQPVSTIQEGKRKEKKKKNDKNSLLPDSQADIKKNDSEPHWKKIVSAWFEFNKKNFNGLEPNFTGAHPRHLKKIIGLLRSRAEGKGIEWTEETALNRFNSFLEKAQTEPWLKTHFLLSNLEKQFDVIATRQINGNNQATVVPIRGGKSAGAMQLIEILKNDITLKKYPEGASEANGFL